MNDKQPEQSTWSLMWFKVLTSLVILVGVVVLLMSIFYNVVKWLYVTLILREPMMVPVESSGRLPFNLVPMEYREDIPGWTGWHVAGTFVLAVVLYIVADQLYRRFAKNKTKKGGSGNDAV